MAGFNFTVQDFLTNDGSAFTREQTKDLVKGVPLTTSSSYKATGTFNPNVGSSVLSVGEMMMGPTVFTNSTSTYANTLATLTASAQTTDKPTSAPGSGGIASVVTAGAAAATGSFSTANANAKIQVVLQTAQSLLGTPYQWGGGNANGPTLGSNDGNGQVSGFDCSGFVLYCYNKAGLVLAHFAATQYTQTNPLVPMPAIADLLPGDLVFWGNSISSIDHVGICIGNSQMIDAPHSGADIRTEAIWTGPGPVGASRPFPAPAADVASSTPN